jgi:raffinose/stachyose/melibiose transport system substrate-binding protein
VEPMFERTTAPSESPVPGGSGPFGRARAGISRRSLLKGAALSALAVGPLSACGSSGGTTDLRFYQSKPEVIGYFDTNVVAPFNKSHPSIQVTHDSTTNLVAAMVRGNPHDLVLNNYDQTAGIFVSRGVLQNLGDLPQAKQIDPNVQKLVGEYATSGSSTDVLPYSVTAAGTIYNKDLFAKHSQRVPTTWDELIAVCKAFKAKGVTPFYGTYRDVWTIQQGLFDYVTGGMIDVAGFYSTLQKEGSSAPSSANSFTTVFGPAVDKMVELVQYFNPDAGSKAYPDGNSAFAAGAAAMYMQGPWAIGEVAVANPKLPVGTFPLPVTNNKSDLKVRVNLDLAAWIPDGAAHPDQAKVLLAYLFQPSVWYKYNQDNLAYTPTQNPPKVKDQRIAGLQPYVRSGAFYQGAGTFVPLTIPLGNYLQELVLTKDAKGFLSHLDSDWHRLAKRLSA